MSAQTNARHAALHVVYDKINATFENGEITMLRAEVAVVIRTLLGMSRSARWDEAIEDYAKLVEDPQNNVTWAVGQGSVWLAYVVDGLV
jgi:hypothetical protein